MASRTKIGKIHLGDLVLRYTSFLMAVTLIGIMAWIGILNVQVRWRKYNQVWTSLYY